MWLQNVMRRQTEYHLCDLASRTNRHLSGFARRNENTHQTRIQRTNVCIKFDLESIGSSIYGLVYILFLLLLSVSHTNHTHTSTHTHRHCQRTTIRCNIHMIVDFYTMSFSITALISSVCLPIHLKLKIRYNMCWPMLITHTVMTNSPKTDHKRIFDWKFELTVGLTCVSFRASSWQCTQCWWFRRRSSMMSLDTNEYRCLFCVRPFGGHCAGYRSINLNRKNKQRILMLNSTSNFHTQTNFLWLFSIWIVFCLDDACYLL